jgi:hypothetical protein
MMVAHGKKAGIALLAALSLLACANAADSGGDLSTITIEALRQDTEKRVHAFVSHAPVLVNSESLARWNTDLPAGGRTPTRQRRICADADIGDSHFSGRAFGAA